jgi:ABC-type multidrug transport system fused ATPase/permease subunit
VRSRHGRPPTESHGNSTARSHEFNWPTTRIQPFDRYDVDTEEIIQRNLDRLCADRTAFVIAHRLSTIQGADGIVVMDEGEIVESGTHEQLVESNGSYTDL